MTILPQLSRCRGSAYIFCFVVLLGSLMFEVRVQAAPSFEEDSAQKVRELVTKAEVQRLQMLSLLRKVPQSVTVERSMQELISLIDSFLSIHIEDAKPENCRGIFRDIRQAEARIEENIAALEGSLDKIVNPEVKQLIQGSIKRARGQKDELEEELVRARYVKESMQQLKIFCNEIATVYPIVKLSDPEKALKEVETMIGNRLQNLETPQKPVNKKPLKK